MQLFAEGWAYLMANPMSFVYMTGGILMGIIFGCIPGLTAVLGVTLMIPFTYAMSAAEGPVSYTHLAVIRPSRITRIRSQMPKISGSSEDITMTAASCATRSFMIW